ncbi:phage tail protein [Carnobacteriaceae bacterium zg-ZUI78]|nr:phage tail protein [Carnobacteriaceae bacterium zg-ZUI78]
MIRYNELIFDGVRTSSFPFSVIVESSPTAYFVASKTDIIEHTGINGALTVSNHKRSTLKKDYTLTLVHPSEQQVYEFIALLSRERVWLESASEVLVRYFVYKADTFQTTRDVFGNYTINVSFTCHPTKFFKEIDTQRFSTNGVLIMQGTALAYPKISVYGQSSTETFFSVGTHEIRLKALSQQVIFYNDPFQAKVVDHNRNENTIDWKGDFICLNANVSDKRLGVTLGKGITNIEIETNWGYL